VLTADDSFRHEGFMIRPSSSPPHGCARDGRNEVFARKEEQKEIGQLEHNKLRRLHQLYVSYL